MEVTFLEAKFPLTKEYQLEGDTLTSTPYPLAKSVCTHTEHVETLKEFYDSLICHADLSHALMKGNPERQLVWESRAGAFNRADHTGWFLFDMDSFKSEIPTVEEALHLIDCFIQSNKGFENTSYIVHFSASAGIKPGIRAHVFFMLQSLVQPAILRSFCEEINLNHEEVKDTLELNPAGTTLQFPIDPTVNQNTRLLYIAEPKLSKNLETEYTGNRFHLVSKEHDYLVWPKNSANPQKNRQAVDKKIKELRAAKGLKKREFKVATKHGKANVVTNPDQATVTEFKVDEDFTHLNLNGGDSWGYWHWTNRPQILFNFKGEPNYELEKLDPEYYAEALERAKQHTTKPPKPGDPDAKGRAYLAFRDIKSACYYNGWYDYDEEQLVLYQARNKDQLSDFLGQHDQQIPIFIPDIDLVFDPTQDYTLDLDNNRINLFKPTKYLRHYTKGVKKMPPVMLKLLNHVMGNDNECVARCLNCLAYFFQKRYSPKTAWIWQGTQGTGKGFFVEEVLTDILGSNHVTVKELHDIANDHNKFMENTLILMIDEVKLTDDNKKHAIANKLKKMITGSTITINPKHGNQYDVPNWAMIIMASNNYDPALIADDDRRYNVAPRQEVKLLDVMTAEEMRILKSREEYADFVGYLMEYPVDEKLATTPLNNQAKKDIQYLSKTSVDIFADALLNGDFAFFTDCIDSPEYDIELPPAALHIAPLYRKLLNRIAKDIEAEQPSKLTREEVKTLYAFTIGKIDKQAIAFEQFVKHHRIKFKTIKDRNGQSKRGLLTYWKASPEILSQWEELNTPRKLKAVN